MQFCIKRRVIGVMALALTACEMPAPPPSKEDLERATKAAFETKVQDAVKRILRDPESARFGEAGGYFPDDETACGEVNAKNAFGGYTGDDHFAYDHGRVELMSDDLNAWMVLSKKCTVSAQKNTLIILKGLRETITSKTYPADRREKELPKLNRQIEEAEKAVARS